MVTTWITVETAAFARLVRNARLVRHVRVQAANLKVVRDVNHVKASVTVTVLIRRVHGIYID